jgi:serine/threonine protein kinase
MVPNSADDGSTLDDFLIRWEECRERGESLTAEELCADRPELAEELARRIEALRRIGPVMASNQTTDPDSTEDVHPGASEKSASEDRRSAECQALYRDLKFHAEGGLGEVFMATGTDLNREVALKFLKGERAGDPDSRRRFFLEAEVTGRLEHPGVVPVYGLGIDPGGSPCYAMRFVRGETLHDAIVAFHDADQPGRDPSERALAIRGLLRRFVSVCNTIAYAHSRGVLHRDIKPRNVMLGKFDETLVVDWGLAKPFDRGESHDLGEETLTPASGQSGSSDPTAGIVGTPQFMGPEQAEGRWQDVGPAADIYSLGATLYVLLTGRSPIVAKRLGEVLEKVKTGDFTPPRQVKADIPPALEAICLKAMALKPADRYATALDLANDVDRWMGDEPVSAYREGAWARLARWARRHRSLVRAAAAALIVGLFASAALAYQQSQAAGRERLLARNEHQALLAEQAARESEQKALAIAKARLAQIEKGKDLLASIFGDLDPQAEEKEGKSLREILGDRLKLAVSQLDGEAVGDPATVAKLQQDLGKSLFNLGFTAEAMDLFVKAERTRSRVLGSDHIETLASRHNLAEAYLANGRADLAAKMHEENLKLYEAKLGIDDQSTMISRNCLGQAYKELGRYREALALNEANLKLREAKLGPEDTETLTTRHNLAEIYRLSARYKEAIALHEANLKLREAKLGPAHFFSLGTRNALGVALNSSGRPDLAARLHEENLKLYEAKLGVDHPSTLHSRNNLAQAYQKLRRLPEAIALLERNLKSRESRLSPDHPEILLNRNNLAQAYKAEGRVKEAAEMLRETLKVCEIKLGLDAPLTLIVRNNLANAYEESGRADEAIRLSEQNLGLRAAKHGFDRAETLESRHNLANIYVKSNRVEEALLQWKEMLPTVRRVFGADHPTTLTIINSYVMSGVRSGKDAEVEPLCRELVQRRREAKPFSSAALDNELSILGRCLLNQSKWSEAEPVLRENLAMRVQRGPNNWSRFNTASQLGATLLGQRRFSEAEPLVVEGYEGMKAREAKIPASGRSRLSDAGERVVQLYEAWGKPEQAAIWKRKVGLADLPADVFARP